MGYPQEAVQKCQNLYVRGVPHDRIEQEMRKDWPTWSRKNLYGDSGWIDRHGFEDARRRYRERVKAYEETAEQTTNEMLMEMIKLRKDLYNDMIAHEATADPQKIYAYDKVTRTLLQLLHADDGAPSDAVDLDNNQVFQLLMEIPEVKNAIEKNKKAILEKIERAA